MVQLGEHIYTEINREWIGMVVVVVIVVIFVIVAVLGQFWLKQLEAAFVHIEPFMTGLGKRMLTVKKWQTTTHDNGWNGHLVGISFDSLAQEVTEQWKWVKEDGDSPSSSGDDAPTAASSAMKAKTKPIRAMKAKTKRKTVTTAMRAKKKTAMKATKTLKPMKAMKAMKKKKKKTPMKKTAKN